MRDDHGYDSIVAQTRRRSPNAYRVQDALIPIMTSMHRYRALGRELAREFERATDLCCDLIDGGEDMTPEKADAILAKVPGNQAGTAA